MAFDSKRDTRRAAEDLVLLALIANWPRGKVGAIRSNVFRRHDYTKLKAKDIQHQIK